jgi:signal transduction histidine kinase
MPAKPVMLEVIRLIRINLLIRLIIGVMSITAALVVYGNLYGLSQTLTVLPSLTLMVVALLAPRRGWTNPHFVKGLLVSVILANAFEFAATAAVFRYALENGLQQEPIRPIIIRITANITTNSSSPLSAPLAFCFIPSVLGAWIDGKRGALRWSGFAVVATLSGGLSFLPLLLSPITEPSTTLRLSQVNGGEFLALSAVFMLTCYFVGALADQQRSEQTQLEAANRQLAEQAHVREHLATTRERVRLARDLHDTLVHTLAGLAVQINAISTLVDGDKENLKREIAFASDMALEGLNTTRQAIADLRANVVADLGLSDALRKQVDLVAQRCNTHITYQQVGDEPELSDEAGDTLFRIAQEALSNIERHAQAANAGVTLLNAPGTQGTPAQITLIIQDDGIGFEYADVADQRFGLRGMQERAEQIGAHLRVDSKTNHGTRVTITLAY